MVVSTSKPSPMHPQSASYSKLIANYSKLYPGGPIPHNMAKTFDGPPTLERSGSEHRRAVTSPLPEEEGLGEKVELSLQERRRGRKIPSLMGKSDASECNESSLSNCRVQLALSTRKDGMICMQSHFENHVM